MPAVAVRPSRASCEERGPARLHALGRLAEAQAREHERRDGEGQAVCDREALRAAEEEHGRCDRRPGGEAEVGDRAVDGCGRRQPPGLDQAGQRGERGGRVEARPAAGDERERQRQLDRVREADADEGAEAQDVGEDHAAPPRPAVGRRAEDRAQQHRGQQVGQQDERDRPRRVPAVVGDQQQGYVPGAVPERRLRQRCKEPASAPLGSEEVDQPTQSSPSLDRPDPTLTLDGNIAPAARYAVARTSRDGWASEGSPPGRLGPRTRPSRWSPARCASSSPLESALTLADSRPFVTFFLHELVQKSCIWRSLGRPAENGGK